MNMRWILFRGAMGVLLCARPEAAHSQIFATEFTDGFSRGIVSEFTLSGSTVHRKLVSGLRQPDGIAVFGNELFVADLSVGTIGEYTTSGAPVNRTLISGLRGPISIALSGQFLYVADHFSDTIGKYTLS